MTRRLIALTLALSTLGLLALAPAAGAAKKRKAPAVTKVAPMRVAVGAKLTIRGKRFSARRKRNTVIFRAPSGRTAFAKPRRAGSRKLVLRVPVAVARLLRRRNGRMLPTRFKLRVLTRRKFGRFTRKRLSPVVVPVRGGAGGGSGGPGATLGCPGNDYDQDLLSDAVELDLGTDPCIADTDLDEVDDGYEMRSANDLKRNSSVPPRPFPGQPRGYPNALFPDDGVDYDSDGLLLREEFLLWLRFSSDGVRRIGRPTSLFPLTYSDGYQRSASVAAPSAASAPLANWALEIRADGMLDDDERDGDGDGLGNWDEQHGRMFEPWWPAQHDGDNEPRESAYPEMNFLDVADLPGFDALAIPDMDGDGVLDGADDNDHDGLSNQFELRRPGDWQRDAIDDPSTPGPPDPDNLWAYTNPFNPCKPFNSDRCHEHPPFGHYDSDEVDPIGPNHPGGAQPPTPQDGDS
jgi:hypothetical protein